MKPSFDDAQIDLLLTMPKIIVIRCLLLKLLQKMQSHVFLGHGVVRATSAALFQIQSTFHFSPVIKPQRSRLSIMLLPMTVCERLRRYCGLEQRLGLSALFCRSSLLSWQNCIVTDQHAIPACLYVSKTNYFAIYAFAFITVLMVSEFCVMHITFSL